MKSFLSTDGHRSFADVGVRRDPSRHDASTQNDHKLIVSDLFGAQMCRISSVLNLQVRFKLTVVMLSLLGRLLLMSSLL